MIYSSLGVMFEILFFTHHPRGYPKVRGKCPYEMFTFSNKPRKFAYNILNIYFA
jgi:hypothetical protein